MFKLKINNSGFTLMEAMVTMGIIAIMSAVYLTGYRSNNQKIILDQAAAVMIADLRLAQSMAMNVKKFGSEVPCGGYGINISGALPASSYIIFADKDDGSNPPLCTSDKNYTPVLGEKFADKFLPSNIVISSASFQNIDFEPPFPAIWIDGAQTAASAAITLRYGGAGGPVKTITINRLTGQITAN